MEFLDSLTEVFLEWGIYGLIIASFTESFISPILPDLILIPLALANPDSAILYAIAATSFSVVGGFIGYGIGRKIGIVAARKMIPEKYLEPIQEKVRRNAVWAIFLAALSPIPYKFVSIAAGAFKIRMDVFIVVSFIGRAKRFMIEGLLIYYFGDYAMDLMAEYYDIFIILSVIAILLIILLVALWRRSRRQPAQS
ncbi:VTT domain-containing protein [Selenomonadales bacterium OttesenSCG-928-I06]|nr:VTT domain-containing protein [Selenomonadales bacterium OttesenSCG-928-I06]